MRILVAGHWSDAQPAVTAHERALCEALDADRACALVAEGIAEVGVGVECDVLPLGTGADAFGPVGAEPAARVLAADPSALSTRRLGERLAEAIPSEEEIVVVGGHGEALDGAIDALEVLSGEELPRDERLADVLPVVVERVRERGLLRRVTVAAATSRPLTGLGSVLSLAPDMSPRGGDAAEAARVRALVTAWGAVRPAGLPLVSATGDAVGVGPARLPGAGAAGGLGALVAACGGRIVPLVACLLDRAGAGVRVAEADLVVVLEPFCHDPLLPDSVLAELGERAAEVAIPVVAVAAVSSLSRHERAQWGAHGVLEAPGGVEALREAGRRIARTWLPAR